MSGPSEHFNRRDLESLIRSVREQRTHPTETTPDGKADEEGTKR